MTTHGATAQSATDAREIDAEFGVSLRSEWVPAPRYLLRRDRILSFLDGASAGVPRGSVVEVGCGAGALLHDLRVRGFACHGLESSAEAVDVARKIHRDTGTVIGAEPDNAWSEQFDVLICCEVLEHIEDDLAALRSWVPWIKHGGKVILSVPAHASMWGPSDEWAGHFRRYSREQFTRLAQGAGLVVDKVECYGFPLANVTRHLRDFTARRRTLESRAANTARSGIDRSAEVKLYGVQSSWLGRVAMRAAQATQRPFLQTDLGEGYLLFATKP